IESNKIIGILLSRKCCAFNAHRRQPIGVRMAFDILKNSPHMMPSFGELGQYPEGVHHWPARVARCIVCLPEDPHDQPALAYELFFINLPICSIRLPACHKILGIRGFRGLNVDSRRPTSANALGRSARKEST